MALSRHMEWTRLRIATASALEQAACAATVEAATAAEGTLSPLIEALQDARSKDKERASEGFAALAQLRAALQRVTKLRRSGREFLEGSADELIEELTQKDALALFERKYKGRHFRWRVKFVGESQGGRFIVHAGTAVEVLCTFDPCVPHGGLEGIEVWDVLVLEGRCVRLEAFGKAQDPRRARLTFDQCLIT